MGKRYIYVPNEEERKIFEKYLEREGIEDDREIQEAWNDFREELGDRYYNSGRNW